MASHHNHCPCPATNAASCYCHCCYATYTPCHHQHPPPQPYLYHPPPQPQPHLHHPPPQPHHLHPDPVQETRQSHPTVSSLLRRIATLESALRRRSSPFESLRDAAARTIQTHFRAFLLRRSITLRHLKDLASIKSALAILKSSVSENTHFDCDAVYHKATNLLLKLDTIQGGDPMIRNGKSSLSRELNKFLDVLEGVSVERRPRSSSSSSVVSMKSRVSIGKGNAKIVNLEKLRGLVERIDRLAEELDEEQGEDNPNNDDFMIGKDNIWPNRSGVLVKKKKHDGIHRPKEKKNVSFVENGKVYRVLRRRSEPYLEEYFNEDDDLCREISKDEDIIDEEVQEDSLLVSDGKKGSRHYSSDEGICEETQQRHE